MSARHDLIGDLEDAIASNNISRRADLLARVSDLFVTGSTTLSDDQIALFDDVMGRLAAQIDETARAAFGHRLSELPNAPPNVLRALALDDAIAVSGTILSKSERLKIGRAHV
mgnify:FL=1